MPLLLCASLLLGAAAAEAERGSLLERLLESQVPGLKVEGLAGVWRAHPRATRITLSDAKGVWLTLEKVDLEIALSALLRGTLRLQAVEAELAEVARPPVASSTAAPAAQPEGSLIPSLPALPVDVDLDRLVVQRLQLDPAVLGQAAAFRLTGSATLHADSQKAALHLARLDAG
ncbi:MAG TPA: hypothetical protein VE684_04055, partial [Crenalkalicoccus sp.]|nr:hypothetical protein [Crenalkalicoccus sp.]